MKIIRLLLVVVSVSACISACSDVDDRLERAAQAQLAKDHATAFKLYYELATTDEEPVAAFHLAALYGSGAGVNFDIAKAIRWYKFSANAGYAPAQYQLGMAYLNQFGVPLDVASATQWLHKAALQKHPEASFYYAQLILNGQVKGESAESAQPWIAQAAEAGHGPAQALLGKQALALGKVQTACDWLQKALANKQSQVSGHYAQCVKDSTKRQGLLREAAIRGDADAQYQLALLLGKQAPETGQRMSPKVQALAWLLLAAEDGHGNAIIAKHQLLEGLSQADVVKARRLQDELRSQLIVDPTMMM